MTIFPRISRMRPSAPSSTPCRRVRSPPILRPRISFHELAQAGKARVEPSHRCVELGVAASQRRRYELTVTLYLVAKPSQSLGVGVGRGDLQQEVLDVGAGLRDRSQ